MGIPVAATAVGGIPDLVAPDRTGLLCPPGNAQALGENIAKLLADEALHRACGQAARERVIERFSMERMVRRHEDVYEKVLSDAAGR